MKLEKFLTLAVIVGIGSTTACQLSLGKDNRLASAVQKSKPGMPASPSSTKHNGPSDKEFEAYKQQVFQKFLKEDFSWIDREASGLRVSKERLPGGYWKLRALYDAIEEPQPQAGDGASEGEWEDHIGKVERWAKQQPRSITARVALAAAWKGYAWTARGNGYAETVSASVWKVFEKRLATAAQVLNEATSLDEKCPHWYVTALWVGIGQSWDRKELERVFAEGVRLEPTYYYLYQTKATYLLPRWVGGEGEWERFAEESTLNVGGDQGDIIFFAIYSQMLALHDVSFMNTHHQAWPRLLAGFRSIEKLYGVAPHRVNEACFLAVTAGDNRTAAELFSRIGDEYDQSVWRSKKNFEIFRDSTLHQKSNEDRSTIQPAAAVKKVTQK